MREYAKEHVQITLIGNKIDLAAQRKVKTDEARQLASAYNIPYLETSAKTGQNVQEAFNDLARRLIVVQSGDISLQQNGNGPVVDLNSQSSSWIPSNCCQYYS